MTCSWNCQNCVPHPSPVWRQSFMRAPSPPRLRLPHIWYWYFRTAANTADAILFLCRVETESSYVLVLVILSEYTLKESCCIISPKVSMSKLRNSTHPGSGVSHRQLSPAQESGAALRQGGSGSVLLEVSAHRAKEKIGMFNFGLCRGDKRPQVCFWDQENHRGFTFAAEFRKIIFLE